MTEGKISILIVDDDPDFREIFTVTLQGAGFEVHQAVDGEDGLKKMRDLRPDLVLLDVQMPKLNGIETLMRIHSDDILKNSRVVLLTSYGEPRKEAAWIDEKMSRELGALDYIKKTDDLDHIVKEVQRVVQTHPSYTV